MRRLSRRFLGSVIFRVAFCFGLGFGALVSAAESGGEWVATANDDWKVVDQSDLEVKAGTALDLTSVFGVPAAAGSEGFVTINAQGEFVFEKSPTKPVRFRCMSTVMSTFDFSTPSEIDHLAEQAARGGYNMCRPHFLDSFLINGNKHMDGTEQDLDLDPKQLDRWDRFAAALKKNGVYLYLDVTTSWSAYYAVTTWTKAAHEKHLKSRVYYDPVARAHWRAGVKQLLEHVNPYTGLALKDDPQVVIMQLRNEAGLNFLMNLPNDKDPAIVLPFREWLTKRYGTTEKLAAAWGSLPEGQTLESVALPPLTGNSTASQDLQRFFVDIERETYTWMAAAVKEMGVKVPLLDYNVGTALQTSIVRDLMPVADTHSYHAHPTSYVTSGSTITTSSALANSMGFWRWMTGVRQWGRPFVCSEWGYCYWNANRHETGLTVPVFSALQGWQMQAHFSDPILLSRERPIKTFTIFNDPPLKAAEYMSALLYRRGDVTTSPHRVEAVINPKALPKNAGLQDSLSWAVTQLSLVTGVGIRVVGMPDSAPRAEYKADWSIVFQGGGQVSTREGVQEVRETDPSTVSNPGTAVATLRRMGILPAHNKTDVEAGIYESDTGQILLEQKSARIKVITPRSEGANLAADGEGVVLGSTSVKNRGTADASFFIGSLTDQPLTQSGRLLLVVATDALNSGATFEDSSRKKLLKLGESPVLLRVAKLDVVVSHQRPDKLKLWALAPNGERREEIPLSVEKGTIHFVIDTSALKQGPTPYFEIAE